MMPSGNIGLWKGHAVRCVLFCALFSPVSQAVPLLERWLLRMYGIFYSYYGEFVPGEGVAVLKLGKDGNNMIDFSEYGYTGEMCGAEGCIPARVTAVHRGEYRLVCANGEVSGKLKAAKYHSTDGAFEGYYSELYPTVGDFVWLQYEGAGESLIVETMPRKSVFTRRSPHIDRGEQAVAANFDYVFIMMSLNLNFNSKRIERYLTAAWQSGATPVVVLTKADLSAPEEREQMVLDAVQAALGAEVIVVSAQTGEGLDQLAPYLRPGSTIVFLGSSGVGKSSLVNALAGEELMRVSAIREEDARGRHTTTHRQLIRLKSGVLVIDTPGMREMGMWDVSEGLGTAFGDIEELFSRCRFSDCAHEREPGCAVQEALEDGTLERARWENYLLLKKEARFSDRKEYIRQIRQRKSTGSGKANPVRKKKGFEQEWE